MTKKKLSFWQRKYETNNAQSIVIKILAPLMQSVYSNRWMEHMHSFNSHFLFMIWGLCNFLPFSFLCRGLFINKYIRGCSHLYWPVRCILLCVIWYGQQSARVTRGTVDWSPQGYKTKPQRGNTTSFQSLWTGKLIMRLVRDRTIRRTSSVIACAKYNHAKECSSVSLALWQLLLSEVA